MTQLQSPSSALGALRLVNAGAAPRRHPLRRDNTPAPSPAPMEAVRAENLHAAAMAATDARWVLAVKASQSLEGGHAAILTPDRRKALHRLATKVGLRSFDASLVIAIVQDQARCTGQGLGGDVQARLRLVPPPRAGTSTGRRESRQAAALWMACGTALVLAAMLASLMIHWLKPV